MRWKGQEEVTQRETDIPEHRSKDGTPMVPVPQARTGKEVSQAETEYKQAETQDTGSKKETESIVGRDKKVPVQIFRQRQKMRRQKHKKCRQGRRATQEETEGTYRARWAGGDRRYRK